MQQLYPVHTMYHATTGPLTKSNFANQVILIMADPYIQLQNIIRHFQFRLLQSIIDMIEQLLRHERTAGTLRNLDVSHRLDISSFKSTEPLNDVLLSILRCKNQELIVGVINRRRFFADLATGVEQGGRVVVVAGLWPDPLAEIARSVENEKLEVNSVSKLGRQCQ